MGIHICLAPEPNSVLRRGNMTDESIGIPAEVHFRADVGPPDFVGSGGDSPAIPFVVMRTRQVLYELGTLL